MGTCHLLITNYFIHYNVPIKKGECFICHEEMKVDTVEAKADAEEVKAPVPEEDVNQALALALALALSVNQALAHQDAGANNTNTHILIPIITKTATQEAIKAITTTIMTILTTAIPTLAITIIEEETDAMNQAAVAAVDAAAEDSETEDAGSVIFGAGEHNPALAIM